MSSVFAKARTCTLLPSSRMGSSSAPIKIIPASLQMREVLIFRSKPPAGVNSYDATLFGKPHDPLYVQIGSRVLAESSNLCR